MYLAEDFRHQLRRHDLSRLEGMDLTAIGVRPTWTIGYLNRGWFDFAAKNGAKDPARVWDPARSVLEALPLPLRGFYQALFQRVLSTGKEEPHDYDCPTPTRYRRFRLRVVPLDQGLLLTHHLDVEKPISRDPGPVDENRYRDASGLVTQCAHCRMTRRNGSDETWDWIPDWVATPDPNTSHGLCPVCFALYYPTLAERYVAWKSSLATGDRRAEATGARGP